MPKRVLVVDDDPAQRRILEETIKRLGYSVTTADSGDKALLAHATQIDPNSFWFAIPDEVVAEVYPWEDYTLARSLVTVPERESDLFEGIDTDGNPAT